MAIRYIGEVFSHFDGSYEKFFYCHRIDTRGARMQNIYDPADGRTVPMIEAERVYVLIDGDVRRRLVTDEAVAKVAAQYPLNG